MIKSIFAMFCLLAFCIVPALCALWLADFALDIAYSLFS